MNFEIENFFDSFNRIKPIEIIPIKNKRLRLCNRTLEEKKIRNQRYQLNYKINNINRLQESFICEICLGKYRYYSKKRHMEQKFHLFYSKGQYKEPFGIPLFDSGHISKPIATNLIGKTIIDKLLEFFKSH